MFLLFLKLELLGLWFYDRWADPALLQINSRSCAREELLR